MEDLAINLGVVAGRLSKSVGQAVAFDLLKLRTSFSRYIRSSFSIRVIGSIK